MLLLLLPSLNAPVVRLLIPTVAAFVLKTLCDIHVRQVTIEDLPPEAKQTYRNVRRFAARNAMEAATFAAVGVDITATSRLLQSIAERIGTNTDPLIFYLPLVHFLIYYICLRIHRYMDRVVISLSSKKDEETMKECAELTSNLSRKQAEYFHLQADGAPSRELINALSQVRQATEVLRKREDENSVNVHYDRTRYMFALISLTFPIASWVVAYQIIQYIEACNN